MAWQTSRSPGTAAKYRTAEHRRMRSGYVRQLAAGQALECTAKVCVFDGAPITNPDGRDPDGLHLGHEDDGVTYAGPQHNACNLKDAAVRARAKQSTPPRRWVF